MSDAGSPPAYRRPARTPPCRIRRGPEARIRHVTIGRSADHPVRASCPRPETETGQVPGKPPAKANSHRRKQKSPRKITKKKLRGPGFPARFFLHRAARFSLAPGSPRFRVAFSSFPGFRGRAPRVPERGSRVPGRGSLGFRGRGAAASPRRPRRQCSTLRGCRRRFRPWPPRRPQRQYTPYARPSTGSATLRTRMPPGVMPFSVPACACPWTIRSAPSASAASASR